MVAPFQVKMNIRIIAQESHFCLYGITDELIAWLEENSPSHHTIPVENLGHHDSVVWLYFDDITDSMAFKLRWL